MVKQLTLTIIGPTASGKTSLTIELAKRIDGEIIGLDSRQIYEGMPIGTAQPTDDEMEGIPHHLFGFRNPAKPFSFTILAYSPEEMGLFGFLNPNK